MCVCFVHQSATLRLTPFLLNFAALPHRLVGVDPPLVLLLFLRLHPILVPPPAYIVAVVVVLLRLWESVRAGPLPLNEPLVATGVV